MTPKQLYNLNRLRDFLPLCGFTKEPDGYFTMDTLSRPLGGERHLLKIRISVGLEVRVETMHEGERWTLLTACYLSDVIYRDRYTAKIGRYNAVALNDPATLPPAEPVFARTDFKDASTALEPTQAPAVSSLKELRMWHWRQFLYCRQVELHRAQPKFPILGATLEFLASHFHQEANLHLSAVQVLNDCLPGTAEQDCAEEDAINDLFDRSEHPPR